MVLKKGDSGADVITLQKALNADGFPCDVDGSFGPQTEDAVEKFQAAKVIGVDGIVGDQTWKALGISPPAWIKGVDVSHYETGFDFKKGVKDGIVFMMTKASEGTSRDITAASEVGKAKAAGIRFTGIYHFFHASIGLQQQMAVFMSQYRAVETEMGPILDLEETSMDGMSASAVREAALKMLVEMEKESGKVPILYVDINMLNVLSLNADSRFNKYTRWLAKYSVAAPTQQWTFWQFTDKGEQGADTDWYHGSVEDLAKFLNVA